MKTLRLFFATLVVLFLAVVISSAQGNKTTTTEFWSWDEFFPCANENIAGEESCVTTLWDGKIQFRYKGNYIGGTSGKSYTWSAIENWTLKDYRKGIAYNQSFIWTSVVNCEGIPIAIAKYRSHMTINANGEVTVAKDKGFTDWICLK